MKKFLTLISAALLLNLYAASAKTQTFNLLNRNFPAMGMKIVGYDPALIQAGAEFTKIMRAVTGVSNYNGNGYYQLIIAIR